MNKNWKCFEVVPAYLINAEVFLLNYWYERKVFFCCWCTLHYILFLLQFFHTHTLWHTCTHEMYMHMYMQSFLSLCLPFSGSLGLDLSLSFSFHTLVTVKFVQCWTGHMIWTLDFCWNVFNKYCYHDICSLTLSGCCYVVFYSLWTHFSKNLAINSVLVG